MYRKFMMKLSTTLLKWIFRGSVARDRKMVLCASWFNQTKKQPVWKKDFLKKKDYKFFRHFIRIDRCFKFRGQWWRWWWRKNWVIVNMISVGLIRGEHANFVKMKFDTDIYKINLEDVIKIKMNVPINATIHPRM